MPTPFGDLYAGRGDVILDYNATSPLEAAVLNVPVHGHGEHNTTRQQLTTQMSSSSLAASSPLTFPSRLLQRNQLSIQSVLPAKTPSFSFPTKSLTLTTATTRPSNTSTAIAMAAATTKPETKIFDTEEDVSVSIAKHTSELSKKFAKERGAFTVVLSGGSLIKSLRKLVDPPYIDSIEWAKWHVFWVDERLVPKDHDDSNYKLAYDGLLSKVPIPTGQVYAINDALPAEGAADDYEICLKQLVKNKVVDLSPATGFPKFDLMLIGMGPDGHVASLFPGHPLVNENQRWVTHITASPKPPPERITFTLPVINSSAKIALVVCGAGKSDVVGRALGSGTSSDLLPVQMLAPEVTTWFLDKDAASKL